MTISNLKRGLLFLAGCFISAIASASSSGIVPNYGAGANMMTITAQTALNPMTNTKKSGWWYVAGKLNDDQSIAHSFELILTRLSVLNGNAGLGSFGFTFQNAAGKNLYLWNGYDNGSLLVHYPIGQLSATPAGSGDFSVSVKPFFTSAPGQLSPHFKLYHDPADTKHIAGEVGAHYKLIGTGYADVGASQHHFQLVTYSVSVDLVDKRGFVPEGYAGYVGPTPANPSISAKVASSWEMAMPDLHVLSWTVTISPAGKVASNAPVQHTLTFQNNSAAQKNSLWMDRQVLYPNPNANGPSNSSQVLQQIAMAKMNQVKNPEVALAPSRPLYHGTWMAFCLNKGVYKGFCGNVAAFWKPGTSTEDMNSNHNAKGGFMNLYLPAASGKTGLAQMGGEVSEELSFQPHKVEKPYRIKNKSVFTSSVSNNVYANTVMLTLYKSTPINAVLNANKRKAQTIRLRFTALSDQAENILLTPSQGAYYEGAATVSVCVHGHCKPVGTAFIEQMGYPQS